MSFTKLDLHIVPTLNVSCWGRNANSTIFIWVHFLMTQFLRLSNVMWTFHFTWICIYLKRNKQTYQAHPFNELTKFLACSEISLKLLSMAVWWVAKKALKFWEAPALLHVQRSKMCKRCKVTWIQSPTPNTLICDDVANWITQPAHTQYPQHLSKAFKLSS